MEPETDPSDGYWVSLEPYWRAVDIYSGPEVFLASFGHVPPVITNLERPYFCESEVSNGGLHQFFMNLFHGRPCPRRTVEALHRVRGVTRASPRRYKAMAFFGM